MSFLSDLLDKSKNFANVIWRSSRLIFNFTTFSALLVCMKSNPEEVPITLLAVVALGNCSQGLSKLFDMLTSRKNVTDIFLKLLPAVCATTTTLSAITTIVAEDKIYKHSLTKLSILISISLAASCSALEDITAMCKAIKIFKCIKCNEFDENVENVDECLESTRNVFLMLGQALLKVTFALTPFLPPFVPIVDSSSVRGRPDAVGACRLALCIVPIGIALEAIVNPTPAKPSHAHRIPSPQILQVSCDSQSFITPLLDDVDHNDQSGEADHSDKSETDRSHKSDEADDEAEHSCHSDEAEHSDQSSESKQDLKSYEDEDNMEERKSSDSAESSLIELRPVSAPAVLAPFFSQLQPPQAMQQSQEPQEPQELSRSVSL